MIDSITLKIQGDSFMIKDTTFFDGFNTTSIVNQFSSHCWYPRSLNKSCKKQGLYFPTINVISKKFYADIKNVDTLTIQLSLPKLLYGTNLYKIHTKDLDTLCNKIKDVCNKTGIFVTPKSIRNAIVTRIDYSHIIEIPRHFNSADTVIHQLSKYNCKSRFEWQNRKHSQKSGNAYIKFYNMQQSYTIYNKTAEILNNNHTLEEKEIVKQIKSKKIRNNLLKFETSFHTKQSCDRIHHKYNKTKKCNFTFHEVINNMENVGSRVLLNNFEKVFTNNLAIFIPLSDMQENEIDYLFNKLDMKFSVRTKLYYIVNMLTKNGMHITEHKLKKEMSASTYNKTMKEAKQLFKLLPLDSNQQPHLLDFLQEKHDFYK